jgi:hypothetical protein
LRDIVLGIGNSFSLQASSNSSRKPILFDWTADPAQATVDTCVCIQEGIIDAIEAPGRKIGWLNESPAVTRWQNIRGIIHSELDRYMEAYEFILTSDREECAIHPGFVYHPAGSNLPWIREDQYAMHSKYKMCSMIASNKNMVEGHRYRLEVASYLKNTLDLFGGACGSPRMGGLGSHPDKSQGLIPYRFHVAMENCQAPFYYTEKLTDCLATATVPIYWGSDCIHELCNPEGVIVLDDEFNIDMLDQSLYESMLPAIRENLEMVRHLESADDLLYRTYIQSSVMMPVGVTSPAGADHASHREVKRRGSLRAETDADAGDLPFEPWGRVPLGRLPSLRALQTEELLQTVNNRQKITINSLSEVPANLLSTREIKTVMRRPRSIRYNVDKFGWFPQLSTAFLLHLPGGFIGDNVVFDDDRYYRFGRWWMGSDWQGYAGTQSIRHIDAGISIAAWGGEAFQHFIMDVLPTLAGVIDLLEAPEFEHFKIVSHHKGSKMAQWFWDKLGLSDRIEQKPLHAKEGFVIHADSVLYSQYMPSLGEIGMYPRHQLRPIQRRLGLLELVKQDRVIFLQRPDNFSRRVANQDILLARVRQALAGTGLELEVFEGPMLEVQDDVARFRRAKIILGPHGGAMANIVFAQPGAHIIEFLPIYRMYREGQDSRAMFWGLAQAAGLDYWTVEPDKFAYEEPEGMVVNVDETVAIIHRVLDL